MGPSHRARAGNEVGHLTQVLASFPRADHELEADPANDDAGCARDAHRGPCLCGRSACKSASSMFALRTSGWFGRSSFSGDYRPRPAPCGDFRLILVRDLRGVKRSPRSLCQIHTLICRHFTGATALEPATSGVTGHFDHRSVDDVPSGSLDRCGPAVAPEVASARLSGDDFGRLLPVCCPRRSRTACDRLQPRGSKKAPSCVVCDDNICWGRRRVRIPEGPHPPLAMM